jgi:hypothetical protein
MARSGTTWLSSSLGAGTELTYVRETWLIARLEELADWFTMLHDEWGGWTPWQERGIDRRVFVASLAGWYQELLERAAGGGRFVEKTPDWNVKHLDFLRELYPDAYYVCVHRDGRNCIASVEAKRRRDGQQFDFEDAVRRWARAMDVFSALRADDEARRVLFVRYEDMVSDFGPTFSRVCKFVGIEPFTPPEYHANSSFRDQKGGYNERWLSWPPERRAAFDAIAGGQLEEWGYER